MNPSPVLPETLARLSPLAGLGEDCLRQLAGLAKVECFVPAAAPLNFAWQNKTVYLLKGEMKLDYPTGGMKIMVGGWGEALFPLNRSGMDPLRARAITDVEILWFDANVLDILVTWHQAAPVKPASSAEAADDATDWRALPGIFDARQLTVGAFASLPTAHIDSLLASFQRQPVKRGEVVVRQNTPGDYYYVIEHGRARVTREVAGTGVGLAELNVGDAFGEEALIAETARNATVTMATDGVLLRLANADFVRLLREPLLQSIPVEEARRRVAAGAVWLDVRFPAEYQHDGLPGALNIPLNELRDALPTLSADREYVAYCQTGRRSSAAAFLLSQRGFTASLLADGLNALRAGEMIST